MQTRVQSLIESIANITAGSLISFGAQQVVFPLYGFHVSAIKNLQLTAIFTVLSIARSYGLRRFFNFIHRRQHHAQG